MSKRVPWVVLLAVVSVASSVGYGQAAAKDIRIVLSMLDNTTVQGVFVSFTDTDVVLRVGTDEKSIPMDKVKPPSLVAAKQKTLDMTTARGHLELGKFCLAHGAKDQGKQELDKAGRMDKSLAEEVKQALQQAEAPAGKTGAGAGAVTSELSSDAPSEVVKYKPATPAEIEANLKRANDKFEAAKKTIAPSMHLVETKHFLIYNAGDPSDDGPFGAVAEKMYDALCKQFDVPADQNIFAGKLPIFIFSNNHDQFIKFADLIDEANLPDNVGGYARNDGRSYCDLVLGPAKTKDWFLELLVHEGTHAFVFRYLSNRRIPRWTNEGLAELMAGTLVGDKTVAASRVRESTKQAVHDKADPTKSLLLMGSGYDYGIAQSFVQFLIAKDRKAFIKFITLLKDGKTEAEALKEAYNWTSEEMVRAWAVAATAAMRR